MKKLISLRIDPGFFVTVEEYEQMQRELMARAVSGDATLNDRLVLEALKYGEYRYHELKATSGREK